MKLWNVYVRRGYHIVRFLVEAETLDDACKEVFDYKFNRSGEYERKAILEGKTEIYGSELTSWSGYWFGEHPVKIYRSEHYNNVPNWCKPYDYSNKIDEIEKEKKCRICIKKITY